MQNTALNILKSGNNVFITGSAGTGKTYLLNQFILYLKERKITPTIVAPTGIAASHLQGQTIHSFFGMGIRENIDEYFVQSLVEKKYLQTRFSKLKVLIVDEISMVSPEIFSSMDTILQAFKKSNEPFGGIQVILSGDFFQLPPISKVKKEKRFAWQSPSWRDLALKTCYLEKKFRQDDDKLINILDEIRSANISQNSYDILNSRYEKKLDIDFEPTKLYTHNMDVDRINLNELNKLNSKAYTFTYKSEGSKKNIEKIFKSALVIEELTLKKDAVVMFIKNNYEKGYINGTTGVVVGFKDNFPLVKTSYGDIIKLSLEDWSLENENGDISAKVSQIPLKLAWAITIHKSQGMTLDAAEIDLSKTFEVGQGYVALSRIKNIEGLRLMGLNKKALMVDPLILSIDKRIKGASKKASDEISKIPKEKLQEIFLSYIKSLDGITDEVQIQAEQKSLKSEKKLKTTQATPTHLKTKELLKEFDNLEELAKKRELSKDTIIKHLHILKEQEPALDIDKFRPKKEIFDLVCDAVKKIKERNCKDDFALSGQIKSKPIFEELDAKVSYDEIKTALVFL